MTTTNNQAILNDLDILNQAIEIANHVLPRLDIPAGTYTAEDVNKAIIQKYGKPLRRGLDDKVFTSAFDDNEKYNVAFRYAHKLQDGETKLMVLTRNIFQTIMSYEKIAGIKKKDRHIFVKDSSYTKVCSNIVEFPTKQYAKGIADMVNRVNKPKSDCMVFNPKDGTLLGISNNEYIHINERCKVENDVELPEVTFKFKAAAMNQIYGRCTVDGYKDNKGSYSLVITNEDGWKTGINAYLSESEMKSVARMVEVQEKDVAIVSGYHSERYMNDFKKQTTEQQEKTSTENEILKEIVDGSDKGVKVISTVDRNELDPNEIFEDSINSGKESIDNLLPENGKDSETNDIPEHTNNGAKVNIVTLPTESQKEQSISHPKERATIKRGPKKHVFLRPKDRRLQRQKNPMKKR